MDREILDSGDLANGRLDPGETVGLVTTLKSFGSLATNVQVELSTTDPYLTVVDGVTDLGDVAPGEVVANAGDPFSLEVASSAPSGHIVELEVRATFTGGETLSELALCIGRFDYLVWDPTGDRSSGPIIAATLDLLQYTGKYREVLRLDELDDYATLWVSNGMYPDNFVLEDVSPLGPAIVAFMASGGCVYLEGGDIWAFDPQNGGFDYRPHFGIAAQDDGAGDLTEVRGVPGTFFEGMHFTYAGENSYVDHLDPTGQAVAVLTNSSPVYNCGVANDAGTYRTVGTSFELGGLQDGASTRAALVRSVMDFFHVEAHVLFADGFESGTTAAWAEVVP